MKTDYQALHTAALTLATKMLAQLPQSEQDAIEGAAKHGGIVLMRLGPLPDCQRVELVRREREGATPVIASMGASHAD